MDPKKPAGLDPKLKEVYERVMGINPIPTQPQPEPPKTPVVNQYPLKPQAPTNPSVTPFNMTPPIKPTLNFTPPPTPKIPMESVSSQPKSAEESAVNKKGAGVSPFLILTAGIAFFAVYALFWLKFFNINLPF